MKWKDAIAAEAMAYGSYVEVDANGFARIDPTLECRGGVVRRPAGSRDFAEEGEAIKVCTDGEIQAEVGRMTVWLTIKDGRIEGGPGAVPGYRRG